MLECLLPVKCGSHSRFMVDYHSFYLTSLHLSLNCKGHQGTTDDFTTNFLHCPLGLGELQACPFPDVVFPLIPLSALSSSPLRCELQDGFGQTWWTGGHVHSIAICVSLWWSGGRRVLWLICYHWQNWTSCWKVLGGEDIIFHFIGRCTLLCFSHSGTSYIALPFWSNHLHFFQNLSQFVLGWLWLTHDSYVCLQDKLGHPTRCRFPCWVAAEYK